MVSQRRVSTSHVSSTHMTRSHTAISSSTNPGESVAAAHDHDYMGDMSSSTTTRANNMQRNTQRRVLSRHQRNADELDSSIDPLENSMLLSRLQRLPSSTSNEQQPQQPTVRRGRSRYSQENSQSTIEDDSRQQQQQLEEDVPSDEGTDGGTHTPSSMQTEEDDSEDNQPLTAIVPRVKAKSQRQTSETRNHVNGKSRRFKRTRRTRSGSYVCDDEDLIEDGEGNNRRALRAERRHSQQRGSTREKRHQKRPRYNEQTDDDEELVEGPHKRRRSEHVGHNGITTDMNEDEEHSDDNSSDEALSANVSSRGRVRRLTAKARERTLW